MRLLITLFASVFMLGMLGCGGDSPSNDTVTPAPSANPSSETTPTEEPAPTDDAKELTPKEAIAQQLEVLKSQDVLALQEHFTERLRDQINPQTVNAAQDQIGDTTVDDLVADVEMGELDGKETAKITMPNDRTLTTLIKVDGRWLADTIWFQ